MNKQKIPLAQKKRIKRDAIISAALDVFSQQGFQKTKVRDIARRADVADGTVYLYFKDKDDLFISAFRDLMDGWLNRLQASIDPLEDELEKILTFFELHTELFTSNPDRARFVAVELRQSTDFHRKYPEFWPLQSYLNYLKDLCEAARKAGKIRDIDTDILVTILIGTMDFALFQWVLSSDPEDLGIIKEKIVDIVRHGITVKK